MRGLVSLYRGVPWWEVSQYRGVPWWEVSQYRGVPWWEVSQYRGVPWWEVSQYRGVPWSEVSQYRGVPWSEVSQYRGVPWSEVSQYRGVSWSEVSLYRGVPGHRNGGGGGLNNMIFISPLAIFRLKIKKSFAILPVMCSILLIILLTLFAGGALVPESLLGDAEISGIPRWSRRSQHSTHS